MRAERVLKQAASNASKPGEAEALAAGAAPSTESVLAGTDTMLGEDTELAAFESRICSLSASAREAPKHSSEPAVASIAEAFWRSPIPRA